jgi:hypothetical protein
MDTGSAPILRDVVFWGENRDFKPVTALNSPQGILKIEERFYRFPHAQPLPESGSTTSGVPTGCSAMLREGWGWGMYKRL